MKKLLAIIILIQLSFLTNKVFSQEVRVSDSTGVRAGGTTVQSGNQNSNRPENKQVGSQNGQRNKEIKKIKSSHPDMSKAKGARPPEIVRPSGSRMPKGIGKPGGPAKRGGR